MKTTMINYAMAATMFLSGAGLSLAQVGDPELQKVRPAAEKDKVTRLVNASKIAGSDLWDYHGNQIGKIEHVLLQPFGKVAFVVIDAEKMLGEERLLAVPWKAINVKTKEGEPDEIVFALDADESKLRQAPAYNENSNIDLGDLEKSRPIYLHWGTDIELDGRRNQTSSND